MAGKNTDDVNGICTPFHNHIVPTPGVSDMAGGGVKGGFEIPDGQKQGGGGETGEWPTTVKLDDDKAPAASGRPPHMPGS